MEKTDSETVIRGFERGFELVGETGRWEHLAKRQLQAASALQIPNRYSEILLRGSSSNRLHLRIMDSSWVQVQVGSICNTRDVPANEVPNA